MDRTPLTDPELLGVVLQTVPSLVVVVDTTGRIVFFNRRCEELTGVSASEAVGQPVETFVLREEPEDGEACYRSAARGVPARVENRWRGVDGPRLISWSNDTVLDDRGDVLWIVCSGVDVTEARAQAEALERAHAELEALADHHESLFRAIFDHTHLLVAYLDTDLRFVRVNHTYAAADGKPPAYFEGKGHFDLYPHEENERIFRRVLETGELHYERAKPFAYTHNPERGTSYWDWVLVPLLLEDGSVRGLIFTLLDVTERVSAIAALETSLAEKEVLLREVHHRVKNNLQIVSSLLGLQRARVTDPDTVMALDESRRRIQAMAAIHERLYRSGSLVGISFTDYVADLTEQLRKAYALRGAEHRVTVDVEHGLELPLDAAVPCGLILNELVTNALVHAYPEGQTGEVTVRCVARDDGRVALSVEDRGVGLDEALDVEGDQTLGLRLVRQLTAQLGGELELHRRDPTRMAVVFPLAAA